MNNERFLGLHFDFHAQIDSVIGERTNAEDIKKYIDAVKPDFIQCDCKGHPGVACYPTKVGTHPTIIKDNLKIWVDTAHECGIPIYMHYSGIVDGEYAKKRPEATFNYAADNNDPRTIFFEETYMRELLLPQLKELIEDYGVDGAWIDGDCWCFGTEFTGCGYLPPGIVKHLGKDLTEEEVGRAMREAFNVYLKTYVDELHAIKPDFKVISNWAYTSYMPEKPEAAVDFLSGDFYARQGSTGIRYEGRCMASHGDKVWDLMPWAFDTDTHAYKSGVQMCQEAASILMLGGGVEFYSFQNKDGSAKQNNLEPLREMGEFVRKRKFNYKKPMISQAGIFYSSETRYKKAYCYNQKKSTQALQATLHAVIDTGWTLDMVLEYQLDRISKYECFIVPEWEYMSDNTKEILKSYAKDGGKLLIIGADLTSQMTGAKITEEPRNIRDKNGAFIRVDKTAVLKDTEHRIYKNSDYRDEIDEAAYKTEAYGKGSITYIPFDLGTMYAATSPFMVRNFLNEVMESLMDKKVKVNKKNIDVTLIDDGDGIILNLLNQNKNTIGMGDILVYDEVPEIHDIEIRVEGKFSSVTPLLDEADDIEILDDAVIIKLSRLHIHTAFKLK